MRGKILILAASCYVTLIVADIIVYFFVPFFSGSTEGLYVESASVGHSMQPSFDGSITTGYTFKVRTNEKGYRDRAWPNDGEKWMLLGDSFTFGDSVAEEERFGNRLQELIGDKASIVNLGVSSYGTAHVLATLQKECEVLAPAKIFYAYYFNDLRWDNTRLDAFAVRGGYLLPAIYRENGQPIPLEKIEWLYQRHLYSSKFSILGVFELIHLRELIRKGMVVWEMAKENKPDESGVVRFSNNPKDYSPDDIKRGIEHMHLMATTAETCGAEFYVIILPSDNEITYTFTEPGTLQVLDELEKSGVSAMVLQPYIPDGTVLRLPKDAHYSPEGHLLISNIIYKLLENQN